MRTPRLGCLSCLPLLVAFILVFGLAWLFRDPLLTLAGGFLVHEDPPRSADAIVVMGGDAYGTRILKAAELQRQGYAPIVVVSGPQTLLGHESDESIEYARRQGYPASIFRAANHSLNSTRSETAFLGDYLKTLDVHKIILVTSNFHTRRAGTMMREANPRLIVYVVGAPDPFFSPSTWWHTRDGEKTFFFEWAKTLAVALGH